MAYLNQISLIGNVGRDPEVRTFEGGNKIASFTLATTRRYTDRSGQNREDTTWHNIQVGGKLAEVAEKYVKKGDPLYIGGEYLSRSYTDQNGQNRTVYEVRANALQLLRQRSEQPAQSAQVNDDLPW